MPTNAHIAGTPADSEVWPVAVFAHDEEELILPCLDSLQKGAPGRTLAVYVLANGCSDRTEEVVAAYARAHPHVTLCRLALGDKANAWNHFIHEIAPEADTYFFMDGDVEACAGALVQLHQGLQGRGECHAAAALPESGRDRSAARRRMLEGCELAGGLYALSGGFVSRIRALGLRLPVGFVGEDGLVAALAKWDLEPRGTWDQGRIIPCPKAGFRFHSLSWRRPDHWTLYWNRLIRYRIRSFEFRLLGPLLKDRGLTGMPGHVQELFRDRIDACPVRSGGVDALLDRFALRRIRRRYLG